MLDDAMFELGVSIYSGFGKGTADGVRGDHILFSPPLNITSEQVEDMVSVTKKAIEEVFSRPMIQNIIEDYRRSSIHG